MQKGKFTKHYFEGSSRVVSKLGEGTFSHKNTGIMAGGIDYLKRTQKEQAIRDLYIKGSLTPPGPPTQQGIYTTPEWTKQPYPSIDWEAISQNQEPPQGWPRYPRFNEPGDVPGPPVQFGEPLTNANVKAGYGFIPNGVEEKNLYYYHPDHLGSSSYITDKNGEVIQHTEYIAFGEVLVDEHSVSNKQPYLFNGKELDYETGLYYYGARYYDPKTSIFLNVDPLVEKTGTPYAYTYNNPINLIDPTGEAPEVCPNCVTAIGGAIAGGIIGGGIEAGKQLYKDGKIISWKAVWGSASQGAITGGAAGFTGGTSLLATAAVSSSANIVGGIANRAVQGKKTTGTDIAVDATIGAVFGAAGKYIETGISHISDKVSNIATNKLTNIASKVLQKLGQGKGPSYGTAAHKEFAEIANGLKIGDNVIKTEVSYLNGEIVKYGTKGSARIDAGLYNSKGELIHVFDLKTGGAKLTTQQV